MTRDKTEELEKEYAELRLDYALEDEKIKKLFCEWETKMEKIRHLVSKGEIASWDPEYVTATKAYEALLNELHKFKISLAIDTVSCLVSFMREEKIDRLAEHLPCVLIKEKLRIFSIEYESAPKILKKLFLSISYGHPSKHIEWFIDNYDNLDFKFKRDKREFFAKLHSYKNLLDTSNKVFNKKTKQFNFVRYGGGGAFLQDNTLEDGRYLDLRIDLSRKTKDIKRELESIIGYFKEIVNNLEMRQPKSEVRRQSIELYKRYLQVYRLVQEKGEKWTEIAEEVFPKDFISEDEQLESDSNYLPNPESAIAKVHNDYDEAKRLIAEGLP